MENSSRVSANGSSTWLCVCARALVCVCACERGNDSAEREDVVSRICLLYFEILAPGLIYICLYGGFAFFYFLSDAKRADNPDCVFLSAVQNKDKGDVEESSARTANNVGHRHFRPSGAAISRDTREGLYTVRPLERLLRQSDSRLYFGPNIISLSRMCVLFLFFYLLVLLRNPIGVRRFVFARLSHPIPFLMMRARIFGREQPFLSVFIYIYGRLSVGTRQPIDKVFLFPRQSTTIHATVSQGRVHPTNFRKLHCNSGEARKISSKRVVQLRTIVPMEAFNILYWRAARHVIYNNYNSELI